MPVIVVANPKGGVGKSTLSTQLAGYYASRGHVVMLGDVDRQHSSRQWLALRPPELAPILSWEVDRNEVVRPPKGTSHVVLDTPAALHGKRLEAVLRLADRILIPLQPSLFDIQATHPFLTQLLAHKRAAKLHIGLVAMRVRENTIAADQLRQFLATLAVPVVGQLRDTQTYVQLAARGLTLWDLNPNRVERDLEQWRSIVEWLESDAPIYE